jgi:hypothetical protein
VSDQVSHPYKTLLSIIRFNIMWIFSHVLSHHKWPYTPHLPYLIS